MENRVTFSVVSGGEPLAGFEREQVASELARVFRIAPEKAQQILAGKPVLKKGMALEEAKAFAQKLKKIGLATLIHKNEPQQVKPTTKLQLEPVAAVPQAEQPQSPSALKTDAIASPNSDHEQQEPGQSASEASINKLQAATASPNSSHAPITRASKESAMAEEPSEGDSLPPKALVAAAVVALVGAFVWKFIAIAFEYELGVIAWGIGGGVGFAAASLGSRGNAAGITCGILVLLSILGGKYMATEAFQAQYAEAIFAAQSAESEGMMEIFEEALYEATVFSESVTDEDSLREFMVEYSYSEAMEADEVGAEEVEEFNETVAPRLTNTATAPPSYDEWVASTMEEIVNISTTELMKENFGLLDALFLFFGIGTAFRLANQS